MNKEPDVASLLARVTIVLVEPRYPENIGAAARCALNMGISRLAVVRDQPPDRERMLKMATHEASHLIDTMALHATLAEALAGCALVVGTTARHGRHRGSSILPPREMADPMLPFLRRNHVALIFGPEHRGLTNDDLKYCHHLVRIPTADFSSLNLAQAVAICCYELFVAATRGTDTFQPKVAVTREMDGLYRHLEEMLTAIGFFKNNDTEHWMRNIRSFFGRMALKSREVQLLRGFCRQVMWYADRPQADKRTSGT